MPVPSWIHDAVFYQIFPDRFANGSTANDPVNVQPWGTPPTRRGFQGGDLQGIRQKLDYLSDLGINALYLNPIFMAPSTHRYDTYDYLRIDPKLGDLGDFHALVEAAHRRSMRVILDGVFNHCSRGFFAFHDILENEADSPYLGWFHISKFPVRAFDNGKARNYKAWWGIKSLPKFNTDNPEARRYLLNVARYWIEQGADGWRLDVPNEIDDDSFWAEFRAEVYAANPEAYTLGEIWECVPRWVGPNHFDGLMNYPVLTAQLNYLKGDWTTTRFAEAVESVLQAYPAENIPAMYNLLGSHDTERIRTRLGGSVEKVKLAALFMFAFPGAPSIYYGDEIGMEGGKDPDCRRAFLWDESQWDTGLRAWYQKLIAARKSRRALTHGEYVPLLASDSPAAYAFARVTTADRVIVAVNPGLAPVDVAIPVAKLGLADGTVLRGLLRSEEALVQGGEVRLQLPPMGGTYLA